MKYEIQPQHSVLHNKVLPSTPLPAQTLCTGMLVKLLQSCLTLYNPMDCSLSGSFVHGILQTLYQTLI